MKTILLILSLLVTASAFAQVDVVQTIDPPQNGYVRLSSGSGTDSTTNKGSITKTIVMPDDVANDLNTLQQDIRKLQEILNDKSIQYKKLWNAVCKPQGVDIEKILLDKNGALDISSSGVPGKITVRVKP